MDVVIGIDTGTTATKGVAAGLDARVTATHSVHYPLSVPGPGRAELDAAQVRDAAVEALVTVAREVHARGDRVVAVSLSAAMHAIAPLAADGSPRGPLVTWADNRAAGQAKAIAAAHPDLHGRTGTPVHPMSPLAKLAWWHETDPATLRDTPRWGGVKEVVLSGLTGEAPVVDLSIASATGLYDIHRRRWDDTALGLAGLQEKQLAEVVPTTAHLTLSREVAAAAGLDPAVPLVIGASDGPLANLGVGATPAGVAAISLGTSGALRTVVRGNPVADQDGRLFCYALTDDRWVVGGAVNNAGSVIRWASAAFLAEEGDTVDAALLDEAAAAPAGSDGLLCLPYLLGERAPWWRGGMRGAYLGLRREHGRGHLVRAAVEGVCQQLALVRDTFTAENIPVDSVRATGGAAASELWITTLASALDSPVAVASTPEGTGLGACLLGFHAIGALTDLDEAADLITVGTPTAPVPSDAAMYRRLRPLIEKSALAVTDVLEELDRLAPAPLPGTEKAV